MANYSAAEVKKLRELTGAGFMDCKKALEESDGDFDKAVELLRIKGAKDVGKRAERTTAEGMVATNGGALIELNSETDFVAKNAEFQELATAVAGAAAADGVGGTVEAVLAAPLGGGTVAEAITALSAKIGEKLGSEPGCQVRRPDRGLPAPPVGRPAAGHRRAGRVLRRG